MAPNRETGKDAPAQCLPSPAPGQPTEQPEFSREELAEAKRQIASTLHKLREALKTLKAKGDHRRYQSQITLAERRIKAFSLAGRLIEREMNRPASSGPAECSGQAKKEPL